MYYFVCIYFMKFHHFMICLYLSFLSCLYLILLFEHTEYCPFKRLGLVLLASPFSLQSAVADLLLTLAFSPPFTHNCSRSLFVRNTATLLTVYFQAFSLLNFSALFVLPLCYSVCS